MVSFIVRMKFAPEDHERVREMVRVLAAASRKEPGCVNYVPHFLEEDPDNLLIYEQYENGAAAQRHRETEHFKQHAVGGLYQLMLERSTQNLTEIV